MNPLESRYHEISTRIQAAHAEVGRFDPVTLIAVSKTHSTEMIKRLYGLGHRDFGENYSQELIEKAETLREAGCHEIRWHFLGHLQTNKVKTILPYVSVIHSIDSEKLAQEVAKRWATMRTGKKIDVFLEVNIDQEPTKTGLSPQDTRIMAMRFNSLPELNLLGLMCIPSAPIGGAIQQAAFQRTRELEVACRPQSHGQLSMGMTQDFEDAIREGSTHVRVGTAIFGGRG